MHFFILAALASIFGAHVLEPLNEQPRAALTDEIVFCALDTTVASPLPTATGTYSHGYHDAATPDATLGTIVRGAHNRGLLFGATETSTPRLTYIGGMDLQAEPTGFDGILSQNGARSGPGRIHFHHHLSGPTPAHHTTVAIPTPIPTCPKAQEREQILMPETAAHTSPPARPIEPALLWGEQLLPPPMARDFIIGIACFMVGCVITTVVIRYGQGTVSDGPNDDDTDNDNPNDGGTDDNNGTDDDGNSDQEVSNKHKMPVNDEDANDRSDRPTEPALLWGEQLLPPPMPQYLAISIVSFMVGCVVTTVAIQYGQGTVGEAANDETVDGGNVVDAAHPAPTDDETVAGDVVDTVHPARINEETVAGGEAVDTVQTDRVDDDGTVAVIEVVDAAQSARTDQDTIVGGEAVDTAQTDRVDDETVDGDAADAAHPARSDEETVAGGEAVDTAQTDRVDDDGTVAVIEVVDAAQSARTDQDSIAGGDVDIRDVATVATQPVPVDNNSAVNDSADVKPAGSAAEPGNSEPWKKCHRSKRGGVKVRARLERRLERQSNMPAEELAPIDTRPNSPVAIGSNDSSFSSRGDDQRATQATAPTDSQSRGSTTEANNQSLSSTSQRDRDDERTNLAQAQMDTPLNRPAAAGPDNSSFSRRWDNQRANQARTSRDRQPNRSVATGSRDWSSPRRRGGEQANEEPVGDGQQSNENQAPTTAFSSNDRRYNRTKKW
ncbi:hypothetical protein GGH92_001529 [Coemansia sp. RSA 2673]|nr:hypothetical protein GGH92_001529 [Coemansia sp. RSA 2673]